MSASTPRPSSPYLPALAPSPPTRGACKIRDPIAMRRGANFQSAKMFCEVWMRARSPYSYPCTLYICPCGSCRSPDCRNACHPGRWVAKSSAYLRIRPPPVISPCLSASLRRDSRAPRARTPVSLLANSSALLLLRARLFSFGYLVVQVREAGPNQDYDPPQSTSLAPRLSVELHSSTSLVSLGMFQSGPMAVWLICRYICHRTQTFQR